MTLVMGMLEVPRHLKRVSTKMNVDANLDDIKDYVGTSIYILQS
jgi:hypothetical protein